MTYVLSDIHGEILRWREMLELIQFSDEDTLYCLGDVIDRNPHGIEILQDIMRRPNVKFIVGNHEDLILNAFWGRNDYDARRLWTGNGGGNTYRTMVYKISTEERLRILRFVQESPDFMEIEVNGQEFYLVHGMASMTGSPGSGIGQSRHPKHPPSQERRLSVAIHVRSGLISTSKVMTKQNLMRSSTHLV